MYLIPLVPPLFSTMSTFRKFVLMSRNELERIKERKIREYDQGLSALVRTEKDIEELLADPAISNDEKLQSFYKLAEKFEKLRPIKAVTLPTPTVLTATKQEEETPISTVQDDALPLVLAADAEATAVPALLQPVALATAQVEAAPTLPPIVNLPPQFQNKYSQLKTLLDLHPNKIRASPTGEIIINNHTLVDSSYNDLIRESYLHSFKHNLIGQNQFLQALSDINADPSLISNSLIITKYKQLNKKRKSNPIQYANGPPGKRPCTIIIYRK